MMGRHIMNPNCTNGTCPIETTLDIIGGKWKGVILYRLLGGKKRFNELQKLCKNVTQRTLTLQLRSLEADGLIKRTVYAEVPPRVEYELTPLGFSMQSIIQSMYDWGVEYEVNH
ncbi:MAG: helix-turn-helix transcriptional regulator [Megasphaera cerevisiae]|nr:helix-turn-helix transcriptional regulator [Megasphaera cerevisiae]